MTKSEELNRSSQSNREGLQEGYCERLNEGLNCLQLRLFVLQTRWMCQVAFEKTGLILLHSCPGSIPCMLAIHCGEKGSNHYIWKSVTLSGPRQLPMATQPTVGQFAAGDAADTLSAVGTLGELKPPEYSAFNPRGKLGEALPLQLVSGRSLWRAYSLSCLCTVLPWT